MKIKIHNLHKTKIAEITSDNIIFNSAQDGLDLLGNIYYQGFDKMIIYKKNITSAFFNLKNGIAGEILQDFSNYHVQLGFGEKVLIN